ncbi:MAG: ABC transporter permease, partial [Propionicimonas sp.]
MRQALVRIGAIVRKEFRHLGRDPRMLLAVVLMPVIQLLLFAYAISFDVDHVETIVIDFDNSPASQRYLQQYEASPFFNVVAQGRSLADVDTAFDHNTAGVAIIIPSGFSRALAGNESAQVAVMVDGSELNAAKISQAYSVALNQLYGQQLTRDWADAQGLDLSSFGL